MNENNIKAIVLARVYTATLQKQGSKRYDRATAAGDVELGVTPWRLAVETTGLGNVPDKIIKTTERH